MNILLQVFDRFVADVLLRPELKIDQAVIGIVVRIRTDLVREAKALDQAPRRAG